MHAYRPWVPHSTGVLIVGQPPCRDEDCAAHGLDRRLLPVRKVLRQHLAPPVVGNVVYLAQEVEREGRICDPEAAAFEDILHLPRSEYLNMADVVALPAVDGQALAVAQ